jgi:DNA-binding phage protein
MSIIDDALKDPEFLRYYLTEKLIAEFSIKVCDILSEPLNDIWEEIQKLNEEDWQNDHSNHKDYMNRRDELIFAGIKNISEKTGIKRRRLKKIIYYAEKSPSMKEMTDILWALGQELTFEMKKIAN